MEDMLHNNKICSNNICVEKLQKKLNEIQPIDQIIPHWHSYVPAIDCNDLNYQRTYTINDLMYSKERLYVDKLKRSKKLYHEKLINEVKNDKEHASISGKFHLSILERIIDQMQRINKIDKEYSYDPKASRNAGLPSYCEYLAKGNCKSNHL